MKGKHTTIIFVIALIITLFGIITGKYLFIGTAKGYNTPRLASKLKVRF